MLIGSVRRTRKDRRCDECDRGLPVGTTYFATPSDAGTPHGPHVGWWYLCLECAARDGFIAPVSTR